MTTNLKKLSIELWDARLRKLSTLAMPQLSRNATAETLICTSLNSDFASSDDQNLTIVLHLHAFTILPGRIMTYASGKFVVLKASLESLSQEQANYQRLQRSVTYETKSVVPTTYWHEWGEKSCKVFSENSGSDRCALGGITFGRMTDAETNRLSIYKVDQSNPNAKKFNIPFGDGNMNALERSEYSILGTQLIWEGHISSDEVLVHQNRVFFFSV